MKTALGAIRQRSLRDVGPMISDKEKACPPALSPDSGTIDHIVQGLRHQVTNCINAQMCDARQVQSSKDLILARNSEECNMNCHHNLKLSVPISVKLHHAWYGTTTHCCDVLCATRIRR